MSAPALENLIDALVVTKVGDVIVMSNSCGIDGVGRALLIGGSRRIVDSRGPIPLAAALPTKDIS